MTLYPRKPHPLDGRRANQWAELAAKVPVLHSQNVALKTRVEFLEAQLIAIRVGLEPGPSQLTTAQIRELIDIALADK